MIVQKGNRWQVRSQDGKKNLGTYATEEGAKKRLGQVEYFKANGNWQKKRRV